MISEYYLTFYYVGGQLYSLGLDQQLTTQFHHVLHFPHGGAVGGWGGGGGGGYLFFY